MVAAAMPAQAETNYTERVRGAIAPLPGWELTDAILTWVAHVRQQCAERRASMGKPYAGVTDGWIKSPHETKTGCVFRHDAQPRPVAAPVASVSQRVALWGAADHAPGRERKRKGQTGMSDDKTPEAGK